MIRLSIAECEVCPLAELAAFLGCRANRFDRNLLAHRYAELAMKRPLFRVYVCHPIRHRTSYLIASTAIVTAPWLIPRSVGFTKRIVI